MSKTTQTSVNFLKSYSNPTAAIQAFLQEEKTTAKMRTKQYDSFLAHKISGILEDAEVRQAIYDLRKKINTDMCSILRLLSLIR